MWRCQGQVLGVRRGICGGAEDVARRGTRRGKACLVEQI